MDSAAALLGICARAGLIASGQTAVEQALKRGKAHLVVMDAMISEGSKKALSDACRFRNVPAAILNSQSLGDAIGKPGRMTAAVTDTALADRIRRILM